MTEISSQDESVIHDSNAQVEELKIKKILIAIDKSGFKNKIILNAIMLAKVLDATIIAIHVLDRAAMGVGWDLLSYYRGGKMENYESVLIKESEDLLHEVKLLAQKDGITVDTKVITNSISAADSIINYAKDTDVDLIIIGTKGLAGIDRFVMGGVANQVLSHAHCRVLAVR